MQAPLRYRDIFDEMVRPFLRSRVDWWDNWSSKHEIRSNNAQDAQPPATVKSEQTWRNGWKSVDNCEAACETWADCVQWSFYEDRCKMDSMVLLGSGFPEGDSRRQTTLPWVSGWMKRRIDNWDCQISAYATNIGEKEFIIGFPWLEKYNPDIDYQNKTFRWRPELNHPHFPKLLQSLHRPIELNSIAMDCMANHDTDISTHSQPTLY